MKDLTFSYNWNNKLNCHSFSTVRLHNPFKYILLDDYRILLKTSKTSEPIIKGIAKLQYISPFYLSNVNAAISFLDANLSPIDFIKLIKTFYKNHNIDFKNQKLAFLVFQYL